MTDATSLQRAVAGCETVIDLVAIISGSREDFQRVMIQDARPRRRGEGRRRQAVRAHERPGVGERSKDLTPYFHAKWDEEQTVQSSGLDYTIFRPSFVFGGDGGSLPIYIRQVRWSPVVTVIGDGKRRLQPIWVDDVAAYFAKSFSLPETVNRTFELAGPDVVTWDELYERIRRVLGETQEDPHAVRARAGRAAVVEKLPGDFPPRATPSRCSSSRTTSLTSGPRSPPSGSSPSASTSNCAEQSPPDRPRETERAGSPKITAPVGRRLD